MAILDQAKELLQKTEVGLRELVRDAAHTGEYGAVIRLTLCAQKVSELVHQVADERTSFLEESSGENGASAASAGTDGRRVSNGSLQESSKPKPTKRAKRKPKRQSPKPNGYPKFFRRGDELVKVGWSKQGKKEYQHKAGRNVLSLVAAAISEPGRESSLVTTNDFMPVEDSDAGLEIPAYQVYLCLGWLRQERLVDQDGRQGYRVLRPEALEADIEHRWKLLDQR